MDGCVDDLKTQLLSFVGVPVVSALTTAAATTDTWKSSKMSDCRN
jgi:hypothetical protein